ncbi:CoxG family protein [Virgibacillus pantothenticus]|uniref:CoxG family protein n=1 Tax=Virgibacillus pantothenticus TaxID=1473 RepID=UPI000986EDF4|nr:SRPBCC family protein [Virgibacillus pantothenticus]MBU8565838.1 SRPBCC family protein [Virgibacillus pantothenticus]MBU8599575.1 SRPBCC family protein [Virgibacillus pantothenticus]MBU8634022.1 SRPBCC family protein [Virgibacillus pantothenticus]MBU8642062.1 SRPBCC family protein [Virgibacillus pantothenticus]MBU8645954.1 SRPBCC family protein [Virgibacillus pantothenticus]
MPNTICKRNITMNIEDIWRFISDLNNWAPLVPGYEQHKMIDHKKSIWVCRGKVGAIQKTVHLTVTITEWTEPNKIAFTLSSSNKQLTGKGTVCANKLSNSETIIICSLTITAKGLAGKMVNGSLRAFLPKLTSHFIDNMIHQMQTKKPSSIAYSL